jgi:hypothetical protein
MSYFQEQTDIKKDLDKAIAKCQSIVKLSESSECEMINWNAVAFEIGNIVMHVKSAKNTAIAIADSMKERNTQKNEE